MGASYADRQRVLAGGAPASTAAPTGDWFADNAPPAGQTPSFLSPIYNDEQNNNPGKPTAPSAPYAPGIDTQAPPSTGNWTVNPQGDPLQGLSQLLEMFPSDPQQAIDQFNTLFPNNDVKPMWQPSSNTIGISGNRYLVKPGTGGNSGTSWQTVQRPNAEYGGGGPNDATLASFGAPAAPYASQPFGEQFALPPMPDTLKTPYALPTAEDMLAHDPGYAFRLGEGNKAMQMSAAAKGTVLSGGTQKALARYNQDYASGEYGNFVNQDLAGRQQNVGEYQNAVGNANLSYGNRYNQYLGENARTLSDYLTNFGVNNKVANDWWTQANNEANRGLQAATAARPS